MNLGPFHCAQIHLDYLCICIWLSVFCVFLYCICVVLLWEQWRGPDGIET